jgi:hypothetical protein
VALEKAKWFLTITIRWTALVGIDD